MINSHSNNSLDSLRERFYVLDVFDDDVVQEFPTIVERDTDCQTDDQRLPQWKTRVNLVIRIDVVPRSTPVNIPFSAAITSQIFELNFNELYYQKPTTSGETMKKEIKLSTRFRNFFRSSVFGP